MRLLQFILIFLIFLFLIEAVKYLADFSDYIIPPFNEIATMILTKWRDFLLPSMNTLFVAIGGHLLAIGLAAIVGFLARGTSIFSNMIKTAAFNLQAYPIVAIAPLVFIFLGDGLTSRLLIATLICYFPLLLNFLGIFSEPVVEVEHFFKQTGRLDSGTEIIIRIFENLDKMITVVAGSATLAMVGTIVAEFLAATTGIGYVIRKALYQNNLAAILSSLLYIGLCSSLYLMTVEGLGRLLRKRLIL